MSSHKHYTPNWYHYGQDHSGNSQQGRSKQHDRFGVQGPSVGTYAQNGKFPGYPISSQDHSSYSQGRDQGYYNSFYLPNNNTTLDAQGMVHLMIRLGNQIEQLNQLIAQNNQLLQSMQDQEATKCVQGGGGGAVIVRM